VRDAVSRARALVLSAAAVLAGAAALSGCGGGSAATAATTAAFHPCKHEPNFAVVNSPLPPALVRALPVLGRPHTAADALPANSLPISTLDSLATGIELHSAQLVQRSRAGGAAWVVPVLHDAPPVARDLACLKRQIPMLERFARQGAKGDFPAALVSRDLARERAATRYVAAHPGPGGPGVIVFTTFKAVQGANATLSQLRAGTAFSAGECAGPGHNLLLVTGLAPAPTATIELHARDGWTQTEPVGNGAYSFVFAAPTSAAGLPDRLVLLDSARHALHTIAIPAGTFSTQPQCELAQSGGHEWVLPAGTTIIASNAHGPDGINYSVGVSSGGGPECDPRLSIAEGNGGEGGGTAICQVSFTASMLTPTFTGGGCGPTVAEQEGSVSASVKRLRFVVPDGRSLTVPVFDAPASIASGYGVVLAIGPMDVLGRNPKVESLAADGHVLATETNALQFLSTCLTRFTTPPATLLAPGILRGVSGVSPHHTPWIFSLQLLRYGGRELVCTELTPQGSGQCFPTPGEKPSLDGNPTLGPDPPVQLTPGNEGTCAPPRYSVISGLVMRGGLTIWFKTPNGTRRIALVAVDKRFRVPGGVFATTITRGPVTLLARNAAGRTVYTAAVTNRGDKASFCGGLDGGNRPLTLAQAQENLQPRVMTQPLG
jgi:hypothetical protein